MYKNLYKLRIKGVNLDRLINYIMQTFLAYEIERVAYDELTLKLPYASYKNLLLKIKNSCYTITVEKTYGFLSLLNILKRNIAFFISLILCLSVCFIFESKVLKISIYGAGEYKEKVLEVLNENDVKLYNTKQFDLIKLEQEILQNVNEISMVSVVIKGNVLIVNAKQKLPDVHTSFNDFVAPYPLIITEIICYQGTIKKKSGDLVKQGEIIVSSEILNSDGTTSNVEPIYDMRAETYFTGQVTFVESEKVFVRTGKKKVSSSYILGNKEFFKIIKQPNFLNYEEEDKIINLSYGLYIPLKIKKHIYYELEEMTITHNFEMEKNSLFIKSKELAYEKLPEGLKVEETTQNISEYNQTKIIQTYLKVNLELTND